MKKILDYKASSHFEERITQRNIDPLLISLCLIKGDVKFQKRRKTKYILTKEKIKEAIYQGYIKNIDNFNLKKLTVVVRDNILITVFGNYGKNELSY